MPILVPGMLPAIKRIGMKRRVVRLEAEERSRLAQWVCTGKAATHKIRHANVLLAVDESDAGPGLPGERVVELKIVEHGSRETIRRALKKNELRPWPRKMWCVPPEADTEFARMAVDSPFALFPTPTR